MSKIILTKKEKEEFKENEQALREFLLAKAILSELKSYKFEEVEEKEIEYLTETEKVKYYMAKQLEGKITVTEEEITQVYTDNKEYFDTQKIAFTEARNIIGNDLVNQRVQQLESQEIFEIINEMEGNIELSKEDILYTNGNSNILRVMVTNKIILKKMEKSEFEKENKKVLETIASNILVNYYVDSEVRKVTRVTQQEIEETYNKEKENFKDVSTDQAYQQIANNLLIARADGERAKIIEELSIKYKVEEVVKENK